MLDHVIRKPIHPQEPSVLSGGRKNGMWGSTTYVCTWFCAHETAIYFTELAEPAEPARKNTTGAV